MELALIRLATLLGILGVLAAHYIKYFVPADLAAGLF